MTKHVGDSRELEKLGAANGRSSSVLKSGIQKVKRRSKRVLVRARVAKAPAANTPSSRKRKQEDLIPPALVDIAVQRLQGLRFYSGTGYLSLNPQLKDKVSKPARHAIRVGSVEGSPIFLPEEVARSLGRVGVPNSGLELDALVADAAGLTSPISELNIYVSSTGNVFMQELAADLAHDFADCGVKVKLLDEHAPMPDAAVKPTLVVAPHEFFLMKGGFGWIKPNFIRNTFMYNTEQIQTPWFARTLPFVLSARGLLDLSPQVPPLMREAGVNAMHLEPQIRPPQTWLEDDDLRSPLVIAMPGADLPTKPAQWLDRPIDIAFVGNQSQRRDVALATLSSRIARYSNFIYYVRRNSPIVDSAATRIAGHAASRAKIYLNIHRDEFPYFEWHRIARQGMSAGALVISDICLPHPIFKAGEHYLQADSRHLPNLIEWVLEDPEGQDAALTVIANASAALERQSNTNAAMAALTFMSDLRAR